MAGEKCLRCFTDMLRFSQNYRFRVVFVFCVWFFYSCCISADAFNLRNSKIASENSYPRSLESEEGPSGGAKFAVALISIIWIVCFFFFYRGIYRVEMQRIQGILPRQRDLSDADRIAYWAKSDEEKADEPKSPSEAPVEPPSPSPSPSPTDSVTSSPNPMFPGNRIKSKEKMILRQQSDATEIGGFSVRTIRKSELDKTNKEDTVEDEVIEQDDVIPVEDEIDENEDDDVRVTPQMFGLTREPSL